MPIRLFRVCHTCSSLQEAKAHREKELKRAEEDLNKIKKKAEESTKTMKTKQQVMFLFLFFYLLQFNGTN